MIFIRKSFSLIVGFALSIGIASVAYSDAEGIAELSDSIVRNGAAQNWDAVDADYEELYSIYQRDYGVGSRQALAMAKVLGQWKIQAYRSGLLSKSPEQVITDASAFYSELIAEVELQQGVNASDLIDPLYGQAMVEYHLFQFASKRSVTTYIGIGPEITQEEECVASGDGGLVGDCRYVDVLSRDYLYSRAQAKTEEVLKHWGTIGIALRRVAEICKQNLYFLDEAEALTHLGDYQLYDGEQATAMGFYMEAYELLANNKADPDAVDWMHRLFVMPTIVPALTMSFPETSPTPVTTYGMTFGFNINAEGKAGDVEVLSGASRNNRAEQQSTISIISGATFRPHFDDSGVIASHSVEI